MLDFTKFGMSEHPSQSAQIAEEMRLKEVMKNRLKLAKIEADLGHTNWMSDYDA